MWLVESTSPGWSRRGTPSILGEEPRQLAIIMSLDYGKVNTARSANLRTVSGNYTRPLVKLVPVLASSGVEDVNAI